MSILISRVVLRNYKSIGQCKIDLSELNILIGPNGAGKSNFIDALRLVSESLRETLEYAIRQRGGIGEVRRRSGGRSGGRPRNFAVSLRLRLGENTNASFAFQIGALPEGAFRVQREQARISGGGPEEAWYEIQDGALRKASAQLGSPPAVSADRLYLSTASGLPAFRPLFDALSRMGFYNINPAEVRELQPHDRGTILSHSGRNLSAVVKRLKDESPSSMARVEAYLQQIVPGIDGVDHRQLGPRETMGFRQDAQGGKRPWRFYAAAMSDGTLRSLGVLAALFQFTDNGPGPVPLVAVEEPESTVHPAAAAIIMDAILEASKREQVVATTHSPDLLDHDELDSSKLIAVTKTTGETLLAPVDGASVSVIKDELYTPGELLRQDQLQPDMERQDRTLRPSDLFPKI